VAEMQLRDKADGPHGMRGIRGLRDPFRKHEATELQPAGRGRRTGRREDFPGIGDIEAGSS